MDDRSTGRRTRDDRRRMTDDGGRKGKRSDVGDLRSEDGRAGGRTGTMDDG